MDKKLEILLDNLPIKCRYYDNAAYCKKIDNDNSMTGYRYVRCDGCIKDCELD